jgi:hypothetical protein
MRFCFKKFKLLITTLGPDCSSLGYGAASELGPLRVIREGTALKFNEYAWDKGALHTRMLPEFSGKLHLVEEQC